MDDYQEFSVKDKVEKHVGDYKFEGVVVSAFQKVSGKWRYVVENRDGILHIFSAKQLRLKGDEPSQQPGWEKSPA